MTTEQETVAPPESEGEPKTVNWWHRDHPTFAALTGFFTGLLFVCLVPAAFAGILNALVGSDRVEDLFPLVLVTLAVPLGLVVFPRTRRFGIYMWIGIITTAIVVLGVGAAVLWYMVTYQS